MIQLLAFCYVFYKNCKFREATTAISIVKMQEIGIFFFYYKICIYFFTYKNYNVKEVVTIIQIIRVSVVELLIIKTFYLIYF